MAFTKQPDDRLRCFLNLLEIAPRYLTKKVLRFCEAVARGEYYERKAIVRSSRSVNAEISSNNPFRYVALSDEPCEALFRMRRKGVLKLLPQAVNERWRNYYYTGRTLVASPTSESR
jgi:hypothetical protein